MSLNEYDPDVAPAPSDWLALDEASRLGLVLAHHQRPGALVTNARLHSAIHVVIETQLALGEPPAVGDTLKRLQFQGMTRHDAIHLIGTAVSELLFALSESPSTRGGAMQLYVDRLAQLNPPDSEA